MTYSWANVENPFFWLFWSGLFLGAAINRAIKPRVRLDRWVFVYLYLVVVVAAATLAVIAPRLAASPAGMGAPPLVLAVMPRAHAGFTPASLVFVLATTGISFLAARYRRAARIPALVAIVLVVAGAGARLRGANPFLGEEAAAGTFQVLALHNGIMDVEINASAPGQARQARRGSQDQSRGPAVTPSYETLHGYAVAAVVRVLTVPDWLFFLSSARYYRLGGLAVHGPALRAAGGGLRVTQEEPEAAPFWFPAFRASEHHSSLLVPTLLQSYQIVLLPDLSVRVTPILAEKD